MHNTKVIRSFFDPINPPFRKHPFPINLSFPNQNLTFKLRYPQKKERGGYISVEWR